MLTGADVKIEDSARSGERNYRLSTYLRRMNMNEYE